MEGDGYIDASQRWIWPAKKVGLSIKCCGPVSWMLMRRSVTLSSKTFSLAWVPVPGSKLWLWIVIILFPYKLAICQHSLFSRARTPTHTQRNSFAWTFPTARSLGLVMDFKIIPSADWVEEKPHEAMPGFSAQIQLPDYPQMIKCGLLKNSTDFRSYKPPWSSGIFPAAHHFDIVRWILAGIQAKAQKNRIPSNNSKTYLHGPKHV